MLYFYLVLWSLVRKATASTCLLRSSMWKTKSLILRKYWINETSLVFQFLFTLYLVMCCCSSLKLIDVTDFSCNYIFDFDPRGSHPMMHIILGFQVLKYGGCFSLHLLLHEFDITSWKVLSLYNDEQADVICFEFMGTTDGTFYLSCPLHDDEPARARLYQHIARVVFR